MELAARRDRLHYSVIARAELFAGSAGADIVVQLLSPLRELGVDREIAERAGRVVREFGLPDALSVATALEHRLTLVTRNRHDIDRVRGLRLRSP